jgi:DNA polymerase-1
MKKLFLLDAFALIYRAHFALSKNPRFTSGGLNTSAIMGFTNTLLEVLKKENPSHMAVVFDTDAPTERHTDFTAYKAHRQAMPEDLSAAIPYIIRLIEGFNIPVIFSDGYEADDLIGTLAKKAEIEGFTVYCMTPDKDFGQLVSENIFIYKPARMGNGMEIQGVKEILEKWEIDHVEQVIDILGLWGDAVDNIPGIPGIGEKTAKQLIKQYGSIENIISNSHELKGKLRENVENFAEQGLISKKLATIMLNAPVDLDVDALHVDEPNRDVLEPLFAELEFRTLGKRVFGDEFSIAEIKSSPTSGQMDLFGNHEVKEPVDSNKGEEASLPQMPLGFKNISNTDHNYQLVDTEEKRNSLIHLLKDHSFFCFDTETTGLDANNCELVGLSFSVKQGEAWYVPLPADQNECRTIVAAFKSVLENPLISKIGQNIKYDILVLKWYDINMQGELFDTMLAHYLIDPDSRHNMDLLAENYLNYSPVSISTLIGDKGKNQGNMRDADIER